MPYFAPYIDSAGIHLPTYEDRLSDLCAAYRAIFGPDAALTPAVPDYQLLSVFAKALDDVSGLVLQAYNSRNPSYATGASLDLMLPQYGITRAAGESDASVRARICRSMAGRSACTPDAMLAAVESASLVKEAKLYVNETDSTDAIGIPAHSIAVVTRGGEADAVAQAIFDSKAPGVGLWGSTSGTATDTNGVTYTIPFSRYVDKLVYVYVFIRVLDGGNQTLIENAVKPALFNYIKDLGIAEPLNIPQLYGVAYASNPDIANTYVITDIQAAPAGASSVVREIVTPAWNEKIFVPSGAGVTVNFTT